MNDLSKGWEDPDDHRYEEWLQLQDHLSDEPYEYLLHIWGGFFNDHNYDQHQIKEGYYYFDSKFKRRLFEKKLDDVQKRLSSSDAALMKDKEEGRQVRYRTIARATLIYGEMPFEVKKDYGFSYPPSVTQFDIEENNYSCDCNRSLWIQRQHGINAVPEMDCGDLISLYELEIELTRDPSQDANEKFPDHARGSRHF